MLGSEADFISKLVEVEEETRPVWTGFMTAAYHQYLVLGISADHPHLF
jgi:hypothetical protein